MMLNLMTGFLKSASQNVCMQLYTYPESTNRKCFLRNHFLNFNEQPFSITCDKELKFALQRKHVPHSYVK